MSKSQKSSILWVFSLIFFTVLAFFSFSNFSGHKTYAEGNQSTVVGEDRFVTIHDQGKSLTVKTNALTVKEALSRSKIKLKKTDRIEPSLDFKINADNFHINIYRSRPVLVISDSAKKYLMTASFDPKTIATEAGVTIFDGDQVKLVRSQNILEAGAVATYKVIHGKGTTVTAEDIIPFTEEFEPDDDLPLGQTKLKRMGEDGRKIVKYRVNFKDGQEVSRIVISEQVTHQPISRLTLQGIKKASNIPPAWQECAGWARSAGVSEADLHSALTLIYRESGCRTGAANPSGAYGIPQALPGSKMASSGSDWQTNPVTQIRWMIKYVNGRYNGWSNALNHSNSTGWY